MILMYRASCNHWLEPFDFMSTQLLWLLEARYRFAASYVKDIVFEAGCGHGYGTYLLSQSSLVGEIYAYDIDPVAIKIAQERLNHIQSIHLKVEDIEKTEIPSCDWMVCTEVAEHLYKPELFLEKAKKSVRQGMVLSWPLDKQGHIDHKKIFTSGDMLRLMDGWDATMIQIEELSKKGEVAVVYDLGAFRKRA